METKRAWREAQKADFSDFMQTLARNSVASRTPLDLSAISVPEDCNVNITQLHGLEIHGGQILSPTIFKGCIFTGDVNVDAVQFANGFDLSECQFHAGANVALPPPVAINLRASTFHASDGHYHFDCSGSMSLAGATFKSSVSNLTCRAGTALSLENTRFASTVNAALITSGELRTIGLECDGKASLTVVCDGIEGSSKLQNMRFGDTVAFPSSIIKNAAIFDGFFAGGDANFSGVAFGNSVSILEAEFNGNADFSAAGTGTTFESVILRNSRFLANAIFTNRVFKSTTDFTNCVFKLAPRFEGSQIHQATIFPSEAAFLDIDSWFAPSAYRTLKLAMESARARREEAIFYSLEQRSLRRRKHEMPAFERFASLAYDATTKYGQSLSRPILWLLGTGITFALWCAWRLNPVFSLSAGLDFSYILKGLEFSIAQIVNPFGVWRYDYLPPGMDTKASFALKALATIESIFSTAFLTLFLLGLRWRFKRE